MGLLRETLSKAAGAVEGKYMPFVDEIIADEKRHFNDHVSVTEWGRIPSTTQIPLDNPLNWIRVDSVICCFVDMEGSTKMSATTRRESTAKIYRYFTSTAVNIFHEFDAPYIDIKGDGVFALFDDDEPHVALAATVTFKSFVKDFFSPAVKEKHSLDIGGHFGIDTRPVLVRKIGLRRSGGRTDRQNEVWAGKPVNMAAKLASRSTNNELWVSDRFHALLVHDKAINSCGCPNGVQKTLWTHVDLSNEDLFDFDNGYILKSNWCDIHGREVCRQLIAEDGE